ncbi:uncharacterized protein BDZ99DRAFT_420719 [Mytilinidion resinicola]|uniref:peptidylprolyl isomerase n=1 Tax=Mytilinidion resinicola TaxID=574789 RepID=A0A6A6YJ64_9PEZI|nr:uncharacterized protein BDZ99DRAFT_420719 [Mytilinidion resinicola]KAF2807995.1 hypothetical protein BDZ99DRAFT_420719 [Mytilinidion resinicola]
MRSLIRALAALPISTSLTTLLLLTSLPLSTAADLVIDVTKPATCTRKSQAGDKIAVNYRGTLTDGTPFDNSYDRGSPFTFTLGAGQVIKGWDQGLLDMCIGEGRKLTIPPELGYGHSGAGGVIGPDAVLVFETELMGIKGVKAETPSPSSAASGTATEAVPEPTSTGSEKGPKDDEGDDDNGECHLLGPFALIIQGALGLLAISVLVYKRWRETPRRPLKIWFFDASKQVFGSVLLHIANLFMSMLSSGSFDVAAAAKNAVQDDGGKKPNPCSFYLLNIAVDTTLGIPILVILLRILHIAFSYTPLAKPPSSLRSGNYGNPPRATWWLKQSFIYFFGLLGMKLCVFVLFLLLPWIAWVGDWALRWTEGNKRLQVAFVMLVFPLIMNAMQYWIIDGFIKDDKRNTAAENEAEEGEGHAEIVRRGSEDDAFTIEDDSEDESDEEAGLVKKSNAASLKEANPTAVPIRKEYDPERDGVGSSGSDRSALTGEAARKEVGK